MGRRTLCNVNTPRKPQALHLKLFTPLPIIAPMYDGTLPCKVPEAPLLHEVHVRCVAATLSAHAECKPC